VSGTSPGERLGFRIGDLSETSYDAVVNPTNSAFLLGSSGVSGALLRAGGEAFVRACAGLRERQSGPVRVTGGGRLPARYVIHVVSPVWSGGKRGEREALAELHERALEAAARLDCRTVAFPAIGCGAHGFPSEVAAGIALPAVERALDRLPGLERVEFLFLSRMVLLDFASRGDLSEPPELVEVLRDEILQLVGPGHDPELERRLSLVGEQEPLREIHERARQLLEELDDGSIAVAAVYVRAARQVLGTSD
jgi:O-acetyl-ADP-ribose deacetylase (regulator of RNase III)